MLRCCTFTTPEGPLGLQKSQGCPPVTPFLHRAQLQASLGPGHKAKVPYLSEWLLSPRHRTQRALADWPFFPSRRAPQRPELGRRARDFPGDPGPQTRRGGSGWELSMVARRLGTQSRRLPALGRARALSRPRNGETRSQARHLRDGLQPGTGSHIKRLV